MKANRNFKWKKGWETVDVAKGGYAETSYEYFECVADVPLLKSKVANVWYIGNLQNGEQPKAERLFYNETTAKTEFEGVKSFIKSELASRHRFERMSVQDLADWIIEFGRNDYVGISLYRDTAISALQRAKRKELEM